MSRYIAVECDDGKSRVHDEETGEWMHITFSGPNHFDMAWGCARQWNYMIEKRNEEMEAWFSADDDN